MTFFCPILNVVVGAPEVLGQWEGMLQRFISA
jgi:hypothetical protein